MAFLWALMFFLFFENPLVVQAFSAFQICSDNIKHLVHALSKNVDVC